MYQPEFIARSPASRTSSSTKTRESGIFFISLIRNSLGDVDPFSGPRRFQRRFNDPDRFGAVHAINQRRLARFDRVEKRRQLGAKWFFRRKFELMGRAFHR